MRQFDEAAGGKKNVERSSLYTKNRNPNIPSIRTPTDRFIQRCTGRLLRFGQQLEHCAAVDAGHYERTNGIGHNLQLSGCLDNKRRCRLLGRLRNHHFLRK